jgi:hypothetical protein
MVPIISTTTSVQYAVMPEPVSNAKNTAARSGIVTGLRNSLLAQIRKKIIWLQAKKSPQKALIWLIAKSKNRWDYVTVAAKETPAPNPDRRGGSGTARIIVKG